ncbi:hypothetical protein CLV46_1503 [Diaminobutyricimonas aerilata]|uniref:Uncharacterized protein n=2 Tax=Diaminobutyricimonas aerilata TaxID=1162967 RepID=A0A2M9CJ69_9MICO|nr:hypothetical protein CLV46_1503 [Diaminobutyricimonas aerilata]
MLSRSARLVRAWSGAAVTGVVAAVLHASAGGGFPPIGAILLAAAFSGLGGMALIGRTLSTGRLAAAVALGQVMFHLVFTLAGTGDVAVTSAGHHGMLHLAAGQADAVAHHSGPMMWLAHGVAAMITVIALRSAERVVWGASAFARLLLRRLRPVVVAPPRSVPPAPPIGRDVPRLVARAVAQLPRRGPPLAASA